MGQALTRKEAWLTQRRSIDVTKNPPLPALQYERTDIRFRLDRQDTLDVAVRLTNPSLERSEAGWAFVEFAPFGAFLPWTPVGEIRIPSLQPGEVRTISALMPLPALGGAGEPPWLPPTAFLPSESSPPSRRRSHWEELWRDGSERFLLAGNVNVHIGRSSVERHLSGPLRLYPGQCNVVCFHIGSGRDAYRMEFGGEGAAWDPDVFNMPDFVASRWYEGSLLSFVLLKLTPPATCQSGTLEVHVEQRSTGQVAVVEFTLDAGALESGCYTV